MFDRAHQQLLAHLNSVALIDWSTGPRPVDRVKTGSKHHLTCDGGGIPLAVHVTGGNRNDVTQLLAPG